jgi:glycosyltransferase involved in cell wall biosynthesis
VFPPEKLLGKFDILHTSDWTEPPSYANKVTTVHDLYHFKFPKMVHPKILDVHIRKMKWVIKESKVIIVPSLVTKEDLVDLGVEEQRIKIIPEAPLLPMVSKEYIETVKKKYKLREDYVVSNGVTVRKNTLNLIKAFNLTKHGRDMKLVLTGRPVGIKIPDERNIRLLGHVESDSELSAIIAGSRGMIFPSLYEGFGLPILEGFNLGVPVVTSNISSMPEVAGGAAVLVNPYDVNSIAEGIEEALSKPKTLIAKGLKVVSNYSWEKNAKETLEVYKSLL